MDVGQLHRIYEETRTIAVVGASRDPAKPGNEIPAYLATQGYRVIPVSPAESPDHRTDRTPDEA